MSAIFHSKPKISINEENLVEMVEIKKTDLNKSEILLKGEIKYLIKKELNQVVQWKLNQSSQYVISDCAIKAPLALTKSQNMNWNIMLYLISQWDNVIIKYSGGHDNLFYNYVKSFERIANFKILL